MTLLSINSMNYTEKGAQNDKSDQAAKIDIARRRGYGLSGFGVFFI
jgi:hypothetical protein